MARKALIIGGGIGGLTCASALGQRGFDVTVIEREKTPSVEGVGISQQANVVRALASLGFADEYLAAGFPYYFVEVYMPDGKLIARTPSESLLEGYPASMGIPRPALHRVLTDAARKAGAGIRYGVTATKFVEDGGGIDIGFSDGSSDRFDFVVGADGIYSATRRMLFPGAPAPSFTGQSVWRYNLPRPDGFDALHVYNGPIGVGLVPMSQDEIYLYATTPEPGNPSYPVEGLAARMRERLQSCAPAICEIAEGFVDDEAVVYRPLETVFVDGPWHKGRIVLLGDAVHATTPHLGQGGGMAIEDAVVLADELAAHMDLDAAFRAYHDRRFQRCRYVVEKSLAICRGQLGEGPLVDNAKSGAEMRDLLAEPI